MIISCVRHDGSLVTKLKALKLQCCHGQLIGNNINSLASPVTSPTILHTLLPTTSKAGKLPLETEPVARDNNTIFTLKPGDHTFATPCSILIITVVNFTTLKHSRLLCKLIYFAFYWCNYRCLVLFYKLLVRFTSLEVTVTFMNSYFLVMSMDNYYVLELLMNCNVPGTITNVRTIGHDLCYRWRDLSLYLEY